MGSLGIWWCLRWISSVTLHNFPSLASVPSVMAMGRTHLHFVLTNTDVFTRLSSFSVHMYCPQYNFIAACSKENKDRLSFIHIERQVTK